MPSFFKKNIVKLKFYVSCQTARVTRTESSGERVNISDTFEVVTPKEA